MAPSGGSRVVSEGRSPQPAVAGDGQLALVDGDQEWVARIRRGDDGAFGALFRAYYDPLCRFVEGIVGRRAVAEEVIQGVFLTLWERRAGWVVRDRLRTYLFAVARNHALNHVRRERLLRGYLLRLGAGRHAGGPARCTVSEGEERVAADEVNTAVCRAIGALPSRYADVLRLRWEHGMTYADIAVILGVRVKTIETRAARALRMIRPALDILRT